ncbi:MAG: hypothetical protein WCY92_11435 [Novosphingobium sp.]
MYNFVDQSPHRLTSGSRFILVAMRGWVVSAEQNLCPPVTLARSFLQMAMYPVLHEFHIFMLGIHRNGQVGMAFGPLYHERIMEMEAVLLALWSDIVADRGERAQAVLELLVVEPVVEPLMACMVRIAAHMSTLGLAPSGISPSHPQHSDGARQRR